MIRREISGALMVAVLCLSVDALAAPPKAPPKPAAPAPAATATGASAKSKETPRAATKKGKKPTGPAVVFSGIQMIPGGGSKIFVEITGTTKVTEGKAAGSLSYVLDGVHSDIQNHRNPLELIYHNTPVLRAKLRPSKQDTEVLFEMRADVKPKVQIVDLPGGGARVEFEFPAGNYAVDPEPLPGEGSSVRSRQSSTLSQAGSGTSRGGSNPSPKQGGMGPKP
jgi:hypothetical protein